MATAIDVATYILDRFGPMSAMKLQKLVYYCQAWHLVRRDEPLFADPIEAWAAGPVVRSLYSLHKGQFQITAATFKGDLSAVDPDQRKTIDRVVDHYGKYSAAQLSDLTHREQPWIQARVGVAEAERSENVIGLESMTTYYTERSRLKNAGGA